MESENMRLDIESVDQGYGSKTILHDISLSAQSGEVLTILGPNGSGKSTLIKTICGIKKPQSGRILIDGVPINEIGRNEFAKIVGYVPQNSEFIGHSTVYDAVLIGRLPYVKWSYTRNDIRIAVESMKMMKVSHFFDRQVSELSGGQKQRVTLARALTQDPMVYVFDEPTSALDLRNQLDTLKFMQSTIRRKNTCMIVALHDLNLALRYSDKVAVLKDGKVYSFGKTEDVITNRMIKDVYNVDADIIDTPRGKFVLAYDSEMCGDLQKLMQDISKKDSMEKSSIDAGDASI
ncbi:MAG: ABC transporter ATP-binding protein [Candidatus Methanarcanum hacksteinii]|nr:ABC transporter ATP-binding protein [Candidatus Methanarcanum hacksteinii]